MANALISHNVDRDPRLLVPRMNNGRGEVSIIQYDTLETEAARIAGLVDDLMNRGYRPQDILILAQRRSVGNPIHDGLIGRNIPSKSYYQEGMIDNAAAQERLAILKLFIDSNDRIALRWLLGFGSNDFRKNAYARLRTYCEQNGAEPWDTLAQLATGDLRIPYTQPLVERYRKIRGELDTLGGHATLTEFIPAWFQNQVDENDPFHALVLDLVLTVETPDDLLAAVIDAVSQPDIPPDVTEVRIMSLHKSKGLSSPVVVIAGCVEGLLPTADDPDLTATENAAALEEQRRLFFVGLTRVKADLVNHSPGVLILTSSRSMSLADAMKSGIRPARVVYGRAHVHASRFIQELGPSAPATKRG